MNRSELLLAATAAVALQSGEWCGRGLDARSFGAVGDGVSDDTAALQKAIDEAQATLAPLYIPNGSFAIHAPLSVAPRPVGSLRLLGAGQELTRIFAAVPMLAVLNFSAPMGPRAPVPSARMIKLKRHPQTDLRAARRF